MCLAIYFIGRDVYKLLDGHLLCTFEEHMSSVHISVCEVIRVAETHVNMGQRSEVENGIDFVSLQTSHHLDRVCDISVEESEIRLVLKNTSVVRRGAVI